MIYIITYIATFFLSLIKADSVAIIRILFLIILFLGDNSSYTYMENNLIVSEEIMYSIGFIILLMIMGHNSLLQYIAIFIGLIFLQQSNNLLIALICMELININLYLLICTYSSSIKYILISLVFTTLFIFGILTTTLNYIAWPLILVFLLKLGLFPFHLITAKLYDGLCTNHMMLLQLPIKFGLFMYLSGIQFFFSDIFLIFTLLPAILATLALSFKRFISLSSSSYFNFIFLILGCSSNIALTGYIVIYFFTLYLLMYFNSILPLLFFSISGIPPLLGFWLKVDLLNSLLSQNLYWLTILFLLSGLILTANYLERSSLYMDNLSAFNSFLASFILFNCILL